MTSNHSIATTTAMLQAELPQLEEHQQALQKELEQVTERLESVRGALTALNALAGTTVPQPRTEVPAPTDTAVEEAPAEPANDPTPEPAPAPAPAQVDEALQTNETAVPAQKKPATRRRSPRKAAAAPRGKAAPKAADEHAPKRRRTKQAASGKATQAKTTQETASTEAATQDAGALTDQVIAVLAGRPDTPLRARDVAQALGRDDTTGNINTVRSTLDRLVATSRAHRAGRGLYQAPANREKRVRGSR
jgi:outer membrane biosynthesis protein TonB